MSTTTIYPAIAGKAIFVTGGASGIGASLVEAFVQQGARVAFVDVNADAGNALVARLEQPDNTGPWYRQVDVTNLDSLRDAIRAAIEDLGPLLALLNNVGNDERIAPGEMTETLWRDCMAVNLDAAFFASQAVFPGMHDNGGGSIVNISSITALLGPADMPGYVTAKAGLIGMTRALATDYGPSAVRVNAILPGWVVTERQLEKWLTPEIEAEWMKQVALKRRLLPGDIANLALFLAADDSAMITGQSFAIDGGRT